MRWFEQDPLGKLQQTHIGGTGHLCACCRSYSHGASDHHRDDVECSTCGELCCCTCHRPARDAEAA